MYLESFVFGTVPSCRLVWVQGTTCAQHGLVAQPVSAEHEIINIFGVTASHAASHLLSCQHMSHFPKELEESHKSHNKSAYLEVLTDSGKALYNRAQDFAMPSCPHPMLWICLACSKLCQSDECVRKPQDIHMFSTRKIQ